MTCARSPGQRMCRRLSICLMGSRHDHIGAGTSVAELQVDLDNPMIDPARDLALWEDDRGQLVRVGALWIHPADDLIESHFWLRIHPEARGIELECDVVDWGTERLREIAAARKLPARLRLGTRDDDAYRIGTFERNGFQFDRSFFDMARSLDQPLMRCRCRKALLSGRLMAKTSWRHGSRRSICPLSITGIITT